MSSKTSRKLKRTYNRVRKGLWPGQAAKSQAVRRAIHEERAKGFTTDEAISNLRKYGVIQ